LSLTGLLELVCLQSALMIGHKGEFVICNDPGLRAAEPQLDIKGQEEAKKGLN